MAERYLPDVIDSILTVVPEGEVLLRRQLSSIKQSASFSGPEAVKTWWRECGSVLAQADDNQPFMDAVFKIMQGTAE